MQNKAHSNSWHQPNNVTLNVILNSRLGIACLCVIAGLAVFHNTVRAADPVREPRIQTAIDQGLTFLRQYDLKYQVATGLVTYTLLAGGDAPDSLAVQRGLAIILKKFNQAQTDLIYRPKQHHLYEASIDIMALQAADPELYLPQLQAITNYILSEQNELGSWYYPGQGRTMGDTSITQYAILGLWAAHRSEIEIPIEVFEKAAAWHMQTQGPKGEFYYHPIRNGNQVTSQKPPFATMGVAATGTLGIIRLILFNNEPPPKLSIKKKPSSNGPRFGILVKKDANKSIKTTSARTIPKPIQPQIDASNEKAHRWLTAMFPQSLVDDHRGFPHYYFYALERSSSINHWDTYGPHDWYKEGTDQLLPQQAADGSWPESKVRASSHPTATCFTLLFLMKATKKLIPTKKRVRRIPLGEGVLAGGRGLPDDLSQVDFQDGKLKYTKQQMGNLEQLLAGLSTVDVPDAEDQNSKTEKKVDISKPKQLIGNKELLRSLVKHSDPKVRQVAAWATGQTDQLDLAGILVPLLIDDDLSVSIEARLSLCWISRRPNGFDFPADPLTAYKDSDVVIDEKKIASQWQQEIHKVWRNWYLNARPYDTRDDFYDPEQARFQKN